MWHYYCTMQCLFHTTPGQICSAVKCRGVLTSFTNTHTNLPSVLWHCWLDCRKGIRPVKTERWGGVVVCLEWNADLHMAQLMPLPLTVSCFSKSRLVLPFWYRFTWVVLDKGPLNVCVCVCVYYKYSYWKRLHTEEDKTISTKLNLHAVRLSSTNK